MKATTEEKLNNHIQHAISTGRDIPVGKGYDWDQGLAKTRLGHTAEGWYVLASWRVNEGHADDPESQSCHCKLNGRSHKGMHRVAPTLEGLATASTVQGCY